VSLDFDVVSVKQMITTCYSPPEESKIINLPLFLVTLPRSAKFQEIFILQSVCHIAIRVEAYRDRNGLSQFHNCQQFGHVWQTASKHPAACGAEGSPTQEVPLEREYIFHPNMQLLSVGGRRHPPSSKLSGLQIREGGDAGVAEETQDYKGKGVLFQPHHSRRPSRRHSEARERNSSSLRHNRC
jgi:hypothetical protein